MGVCGSTNLTPDQEKEKAQKKTSKQIDHELCSDKKKDRNINKLLLLGAGQSGKSTLFKQMKLLYIKGFTDNEREQCTSAVHANVISSIQALCENSDYFGQKVSNEFKVDDKLVDIKNDIEHCSDDEFVNEDLALKIQKLWADKGIQKTYKNRSKFLLNDSTAYFFGRLDDIGKLGYVPTEQDVLRTRVPTTGIVENEFAIEGNVFRMFDVGGQRSERKKWIHCFENVTAVLFVAAISAYDQVLYEDEQTNRMVESLGLFEKMCNNEWFENTAMILFLNKDDIFKEKIKEIPLQNYFTNFKRKTENLYEDAVDFIVEMFESKGKSVYTHVTVATSSRNIFVVFSVVKDIIIKQGLERAGLT